MSDRTAMLNHIQIGPRNPNWKGGRFVASNGYVLIRCPGHHLADVRGYAYEHRLVASRKIGRMLLPLEQVHHVNGNKQDNRPENLEVVLGVAEHQIKHRKKDKGLRVPGQANPIITCACGCGAELETFDRAGRPRRYISGHNPQPARLRSALLLALSIGPQTRTDLAAQVGTTAQSVGCALTRLKALGLVANCGTGTWRLV